MCSVKTFVRAMAIGTTCLALGWGVDHASAQQATGEKSVRRIAIQPQPPGGATPAPADAELLPALPPEQATEPPRRPPPAAVVALPPDVPPLGLPSDGEAAPSFPDLPDLPESSLLPQTPADEGNGTPSPGGPTTEDGTLPPLNPPSGAGLTPPPADSPFPIWHESPKKARALAESAKRCLLLVFTSSQGEAGGSSKQLSDEVFAAPAFNEFALNHLVLCGLFYSRSSSLDLNDPAKMARLDAMAAFKKAFRVRGFPCVILFGPDGREINRWSGYVTGRGPGYHQQIKQAVEGHEAVLFATERRRESLAAKGYRTWMSAQGTPLFARLIEFDADSALLRDEAGADRKVRLKQLALPDREIITRQRLGRPMPERAPAAAATPSATTLQ
jgi:hypothetical protein